MLRRVTGGLPGAGPVRALDAGGGVWLIAADVGEAEYGESSIGAGLKDLDWVSRRAIGHEAIVEQFLAADAVLPMQLFTIFTNDDRAFAHVRRDRRRIERILKRIAGQVEWGVRLTWDEQSVRAAVEKAHTPSVRGRAASGSAYLARKRDLLEVNRTQLARARSEATKVHRLLSKHVSDAVRRTSTEQAAPGARLLLDAAYLVPSKRGAAFRAEVRRAARALEAGGIRASLTGPWPAYNFIAS